MQGSIPCPQHNFYSFTRITMKITIKDESDVCILSDDHIDHDNFIELTVQCTEGEQEWERTICICIDDLQSALSAFMVQRELRHERDLRYSEART